MNTVTLLVPADAPSVADETAPWSERYQAVRALTEALAEPLSAEDQVVQSMDDVSPTKWHRAHTTWFFETFLLQAFHGGYDVADPAYAYLFNSYYEAIGDRHPRPQRGLLSRPSVADVSDYRRHVDDAMLDLIDSDLAEAAVGLLELGLHHEQQHQELLLMDIKHVLSVNPLLPQYRGAAPSPAPSPGEHHWTVYRGEHVDIGHDGHGFSFDNELPRHREIIRPFELGSRLITAGEWLDFIAAGGYDTAELWLADGWSTVQAHGWSAPHYWTEADGAWQVFTLDGARPVEPGEPVCHISYYEADAFARWAGARLPTEHEWEHAAADAAPSGNLLADSRLHPTAARSGRGLQQMIGDVWEWTSSPYSPYPGFTAAPGAVGEYNGKFMVNQHVLRGGCALTPPGHIRTTYRNFFNPHARWQMGGVRLARHV